MYRIAIADDDQLFLDRFAELLENAFPKSFEIITFPLFKKARTAVRRIKFSAVLISESTVKSMMKPGAESEDLKKCLRDVKKHCRVAVLRENSSSDNLSDYCTEELDIQAVNKYISIDEWNEFLVALCSGEAGSHKGGNQSDSSATGKICLFSSGCGGVGASTAAVAFCRYLTESGAIAAYLNFEMLSSGVEIPKSGRKYGMDDIVFALRNSKDMHENMSEIINMSLYRNKYGIFTINPIVKAENIFSLTGEEIINISLETAKILSSQAQTEKRNSDPVIVLDMDFTAAENIVLPFINAEKAVIVTDGRNSSNIKTAKLIQLLPEMCGLRRQDVLSKLLILYNRFKDGDSRLFEETVKELPYESGLNSFEEGYETGKLGGIDFIKASSEEETVKYVSESLPIKRLVRELYEFSI